MWANIFKHLVGIFKPSYRVIELADDLNELAKDMNAQLMEERQDKTKLWDEIENLRKEKDEIITELRQGTEECLKRERQLVLRVESLEKWFST